MSWHALVVLQAANKRRNLKFHIIGELLEDLQLGIVLLNLLHFLARKLLCCCVIYLRTLESAFLSEFSVRLQENKTQLSIFAE